MLSIKQFVEGSPVQIAEGIQGAQEGVRDVRVIADFRDLSQLCHRPRSFFPKRYAVLCSVPGSSGSVIGG